MSTFVSTFHCMRACACVPVRAQGIYVEMLSSAAAPDLRRLNKMMIWQWQRRQKQALQLPLLMDENYHANQVHRGMRAGRSTLR